MQGRIVTSPFTRSWVLAAASAVGVFGWSHAAGAATILVDIGAANEAGTNNVDPSGRQFNDVVANRNPIGTSGATTLAGTAVPLVDSTNAGTGVSLTISNPTGQAYQRGFDDVNFNGGAATVTGQAAALGYTAAETNNNSFGNTGTFNGLVDPVTRITLSGLNPTTTYGFNLFAARAASDNRDTLYTITGGTGSTALVEPVANNTGTVASASGFTPTVAGTITIDVTAASTNTNSTGLYYLGILQVNTTPATAVPEPASLGIVGMAGAAMAARRRRA